MLMLLLALLAGSVSALIQNRLDMSTFLNISDALTESLAQSTSSETIEVHTASVEFETCFDLKTGEPYTDPMDPMDFMSMDCSASSVKFPYGGGTPHARTWWSEIAGTRAALVDKDFDDIFLDDIDMLTFCTHINDDCNTNWDDKSTVGKLTMILDTGPGTDDRYWKVLYLSEDTAVHTVAFKYSLLATKPLAPPVSTGANELTASVEFETCFDLQTGEPYTDPMDPMEPMPMDCPASTVKFPYGGGTPHARTWWSEKAGTRAALVDKDFDDVFLDDIDTFTFCTHINDDCNTNWDDESTVGKVTMILDTGTGTDDRYWKLLYISEDNGAHTVTFKYSALTDAQSASATEDPHVTNVRGEMFDLWHLGQVQFLRIPFEATEYTADIVLTAMVRNVTSDWALNACLSPYITETTLSGRFLERPVTTSVNLPGHILVAIDGAPVKLTAAGLYLGNGSGQPVLLKIPDKSVRVHTKSFNGVSAVEVLVGGATIQITAGKAHINILANKLLSFGKRIGGLLGEDDHTDLVKPPKPCDAQLGAKQRVTSLRRVGERGNVASYR